MEDMTWQQIKTRAVFVFHDAVPGQHSAGMWGMAESGADYRCIVNRPLPARLICGAAKRKAGNADYFKSAKRKFANFVRLIKSFQSGFRHFLRIKQLWAECDSGFQREGVMDTP